MLNLHVQATSRTVNMADDYELPLHGSYIHIQTAVGSVWLDGDIVTFEDGMSGTFAQAGFEVVQHHDVMSPTSTGGTKAHRRLTGVNELIGVFNSIQSFEGWPASRPLPRIPETYTATVKSMYNCKYGGSDRCHQTNIDAAHLISYQKAGANNPMDFAFTVQKVWADASKGLVREQLTHLPGLDGISRQLAPNIEHRGPRPPK